VVVLAMLSSGMTVLCVLEPWAWGQLTLLSLYSATGGLWAVTFLAHWHANHRFERDMTELGLYYSDKYGSDQLRYMREIVDPCTWVVYPWLHLESILFGSAWFSAGYWHVALAHEILLALAVVSVTAVLTVLWPHYNLTYCYPKFDVTHWCGPCGQPALGRHCKTHRTKIVNTHDPREWPMYFAATVYSVIGLCCIVVVMGIISLIVCYRHYALTMQTVFVQQYKERLKAAQRLRQKITERHQTTHPPAYSD
jgi:hypothetical protein